MTTLTHQETSELVNHTLQLNEEEMKKSSTYNITGRFVAAVIMKHVDMDKEDFYKYNPDFDNEIALKGTYTLRLPVQKMNHFIAKRYEILEESIQRLMKGAGGQ